MTGRRATAICAVMMLGLAGQAQGQAPLSTSTQAQTRVQQQEAAARRKRQNEARIAAQAAEAARQKVQADLRGPMPSADLRTNFQTYRAETLKANSPRSR